MPTAGRESSPETRRRIAELERELAACREREAEARAQQAATSEILRAIAGAPGDPQAVLDTIAERAAHLCDTYAATILRADGDLLIGIAHYGFGPLMVGAPAQGPVRNPAGARSGRGLPIRGSFAGRAVLDRKTVHIPDTATASAEEFPIGVAHQPLTGQRTTLVTPLLRDGEPLGVIMVRRREVRPFTDEQIRLLETFADQAVIAIENARLFEELEQSNRDLSEALEQQTATADILRVIASSPTDITLVFDHLLRSALALCGSPGDCGAIFLVEGQALVRVAISAPPDLKHDLERAAPIPLDRAYLNGRAILDRTAQHTVDRTTEPGIDAGQIGGVGGFRSELAVPLMREGAPIGTIGIARRIVAPFTQRQVEVIQTFADQAVIAIENARLFEELEERNRELTESLEQQTATAEILRVIASAPADPTTVLDAIASAAARFTDSEGAAIQQVFGEHLRWVGRYGRARQGAEAAESAGLPGNPISAGTMSGRALLERRTIHVPDVAAVVERDFPESLPVYRLIRQRSQVTTPLLRDGAAIGVLGVFRWDLRPFTEQQIKLLETFADQAVIAIENARLFEELARRNEELSRRTSELSEALEQQSATAEVLRVIASSPTDLDRVLQAVVESAARLGEADAAVLHRAEGDLLVSIGCTDPAFIGQSHPYDRDSVNGRAILETRTVHAYDPEPEQVAKFPKSRAHTFGLHSQVATPLLREGVAIGVLTVYRKERRPFSDRQIALLETFADQAAIAIENARLFQELEERTGELARALEQQTALGEVGQAVSSSLDLQTVLSTIVAHADRLCGTDGGVIFEYDEQADAFVFRASSQQDDSRLRIIQSAPPRMGEGAVGRAALERAPVQIADIRSEGAYRARIRDELIESGTRAILAVPLLREDRVLGGIVLTRQTPGAFPPEVVSLLQTFAGQSVLAIENARLFQEVEEKGRELEVASKHKSEFLANMSHELRTPLNAILSYSQLLREEAEDTGQDESIADLDKIHAAGEHLLRLINDILDLSKIEAGRMDLYLETFDVPTMVHDAVAVVRPLVERNGNTLVVECSSDVGTMHADQVKVRQALLNLLSNAAKFTEQGTVGLVVRREDRSRGAVAGGATSPHPSPLPEGEGTLGWFSFGVSDTGIGMTEEQLGRLFEAFSQADSSTTRRYGGTGLGLAISRHFCRLMGGDVQVESEPGRGSTFTITLPVDVQMSDGQRGDSAEVDGSSGIQPPTDPTLPTILVVDDDPTVRELMQRFLRSAGFNIVTAASGEEGLRLARELRPDAMTLDVMMPGMDGWAVLAALKADRDLADIPVTMLTIVEDRSMGYALGAADYLTKPIDRERLVAALMKYRRDRPPRDVLIVEDDPATRETVRRALEHEGWTVAEAENGKVALAAVAARRPSVILLDLMMPEMDGFQFIGELRTRPEWRDVPIVVMTAKDLTEEDRERLNGYIMAIVQKAATSRDVFLSEVRDQLAASLRHARSP